MPLAAIDTDAVIPLAPAVSAKGRLVDADTGEPLAKRHIDFGLQVNQSLGSFSRNYFGLVSTDERGEFQLRGMVPVWDFFIEITAERDKQTEIPEKAAEKVFHSETVEAIDLGDIKVPGEGAQGRRTIVRCQPCFEVKNACWWLGQSRANDRIWRSDFFAAMARWARLPGHRWPVVRIGNGQSIPASFCPSHR